MIRRMKDDDLSKVIEIDNQGIEHGKATFRRVGYTEEQWNLKYLKKCRFVYEIDGQVVGWVALIGATKSPAYTGVGEISIYIDNNYQGMGIGKSLMEAVIEDSEKEGLWTLESFIFSDNIKSIQLHKNFGFEYIGTRKAIAKDKFDNWKDIVILERRSDIY